MAGVSGFKCWVGSDPDITIKVVIDNTHVLYMVNSGFSRNIVCMSVLKEVDWACFLYNVDIFTSADNTLADVISHCDAVDMRLIAIDCLTRHNMCCF